METNRKTGFISRFYAASLKLLGGSLIDLAVGHGLNKHTGTRMAETLLKEEYHAEKQISYIRGSFLFIYLIIQLIRTFVFAIPFNDALLPALTAFLISAGIIGDYHFLGTKRYEQFFSRFTKYLVITVDAFGIPFLLFHIISQGINQPYSSAVQIFPVGMVIAGTLSVLTNIYRNNPVTCIYNWFLLLISFTLFQQQLTGTGSFFLLPDGQPNFQIIQFYAIITVCSALGILITRRMRKIMVRSKRQDQLERFLPEMVAKEVLNGDKDISAGGTRHTVTIMFADIRNFTSYSEQNRPEEVINLLNAYFNDMINVIFKYHGTLDKILGDGLMAIFGAPFPSPQDPANAVRTALDMQFKLEKFNELRSMSGQPSIEIGIGIHTGEAILGNVGSDRRFDFTVIGDAVNTAARLEGLSKNYDENIIISAATLACLSDNFVTKPLGTATVKGKAKPLEIFTVSGYHDKKQRTDDTV